MFIKNQITSIIMEVSLEWHILQRKNFIINQSSSCNVQYSLSIQKFIYFENTKPILTTTKIKILLLFLNI